MRDDATHSTFSHWLLRPGRHSAAQDWLGAGHAGYVGAEGADGGHRGASGRHLCLRRRVQGEGRGLPGDRPGPAVSAARSSPSAVKPPWAHGCASISLSISPGWPRRRGRQRRRGQGHSCGCGVLGERGGEAAPPRGGCGEEEGRGLCLLLSFSFTFHSGCWLGCEAKQDKKYFKHCSESKADPWAKVREGA